MFGWRRVRLPKECQLDKKLLLVAGITESVVGRIATRLDVDNGLDHVYLVRQADQIAPAGYAGVLAIGEVRDLPTPNVSGVAPLSYLDDGDVVAMYPSGVVQVLYRHTSPYNSILLTERCNSLCLMCSQPPRTEDDSWLVPIILRTLDLIEPSSCQELGFTGGEPTLLGGSFFEILEQSTRSECEQASGSG